MEGELLADQPLGQKLIKKGFWLYFFTMFIGPAGYFIRMLVSNSISVADVGIIYSVMGLIGILSAYHDLGLTEALQYHLPKYRIGKKYNAFKTSVRFTFIIQTIAGLIIAFILFFGANYLGVHYFHSPESVKIIKIFCIYFLGMNFFNMLYSIYIAFQDVIQYKLIEFIRMYITLGFILLFFFLGILSTINFAWAWIIGVGVSLLFSGIIFFRKYRYTLTQGKIERNKTLLKKQIKYAFRVFIGINVIYLLGQVDQQFIIYFLGAKQAGYYANYLSLILSFSVLISPLLSYIFPLTTELIEKQEHEKIKELKNILYKYFSIFAISISGLFIALGPEIATILFGQKFLYSGQLLGYSAGLLIFYVLFNINLNFLAGMGKVKQRAKIIGIALISNIILNFIFIQFWGTIGVIAATMISWIMLFIMSYRLMDKNREIQFNRQYLIKNIVIIATLGATITLIKEHFFILEDTHRYKNLLYLVLVGGIYFIVIAGTNRKNISLLKKEIKNIKK